MVYQWKTGVLPPRAARRERLKGEVSRLFGAHEGTYGAPRITADLREAGWTVSQNTVAALLREQGLAARRRKQRRCTTRPGKGRWRAPDLVKRDFAAEGINQKWYGDGTEIPTGQGKLHLASVLDMGSRRVVGFALSEHHDAQLAYGALAMAVAVRGGSVPGVIMHTDGGSEYTANLFRAACGRLQIRQSMGRPSSALDNAVIEAWHSTLTFPAALPGDLRHQGGRPSPGSRLDRGLQPAPAALRVRHAQPPRLRTRPNPPAGRVTHRLAIGAEPNDQRRRLRRRWSCGAREGYGAAPQASRVLRIALHATHLRCALDPRASATPQAGNAGRPSLPSPRADTTRPATPFNITTTEVSTVRGD